VAPGDTCPIRVGVRLRNLGYDETVRVRFETNDPARPGFEHIVVGRCPAPFIVTPKFADFGQVVEGSAPALTLTVRDRDDRPLPSTADIKWSTSHPDILLERV